METTAARESTVRSERGVRLHVREVGRGRPILVLHGGPGFDHEYFLPDLDRLADIGRLVYYDQRGCGRSFSGEMPGDISIETEMADLDHVRRWAGAASVALIGHSWGALLAMEYAIRSGEHVSHLVLLNPAPASHADNLALRDHLARSRSPRENKRMEALRSDPAYRAGDPGTEAEFNRIHFGRALRRPEHLDEILGRLRRAVTSEGIVVARAIESRLYEQTWLVESYNLLPQLRNLSIPTLVLHGDHDFIPLAVARHIADAIPGARLRSFPTAATSPSSSSPMPSTRQWQVSSAVTIGRARQRRRRGQAAQRVPRNRVLLRYVSQPVSCGGRDRHAALPVDLDADARIDQLGDAADDPARGCVNHVPGTADDHVAPITGMPEPALARAVVQARALEAGMKFVVRGMFATSCGAVEGRPLTSKTCT